MPFIIYNEPREEYCFKIGLRKTMGSKIDHHTFFGAAIARLCNNRWRQNGVENFLTYCLKSALIKSSDYVLCCAASQQALIKKVLKGFCNVCNKQSRTFKKESQQKLN